MNIEKINLATIVGLLLSDGCIVGTRVKFKSKSKDLAETFKNLVERTFNVKAHERVEKAKRKDTMTKVFTVTFSNKDIVRFLLTLTPSFRTLACDTFPICKNASCHHTKMNGKIVSPAKVPDFIMNGNKEIKRAFLKGLFSGDGGISFTIAHRKKKFTFNLALTLAKDHPRISKQVIKLLNEFNLNIGDDGWHHLRIRDTKEIKKFLNEIGFLNESTISRSKRWNGISKNAFLSEIIKLKNMRRGFWKRNFSSTEEICKFILDRLLAPKRNQG